MISGLSGVAGSVKGSTFGRVLMKNKLSVGFAALNIGSTVAADYQTPQERNTAVAGSLFETMLMFSTKGALSQIALGTGFTLLAAAPQFGTALFEGIKSTQSTRTSLAIPFSQGVTGNMQAQAAFSSAQREMGSAYSSMGNIAAVYASKYLTRQ